MAKYEIEITALFHVEIPELTEKLHRRIVDEYELPVLPEFLGELADTYISGTISLEKLEGN